MLELKKLTDQNNALTRPATEDDINALEVDLGFSLPPEYKSYLSTFGLISFGAEETYGLGVSNRSHLHLMNIYKDLSSDKNYPPYNIPILELGDGNYYLYDTKKNAINLWATPNGGIVNTINQNLESFLAKQIFSIDI